ncbi:hypothetical protein [Vreelandella titanicae]|uniref:Uncharacterized protein n=1 Tax=Vreelandella titanicae TaxID=664683 RepID=A0A558JEN0_9GAMM|nr:hypothetical protein [Halomonas titanicae]TVU92078.1 hypothetical protein FQP89_02830 [Halomonas titanicae]
MAEIDSLSDGLINLKCQQHFRAFWNHQDQASSDMDRGRVGIESLWSPANRGLSRLRAFLPTLLTMLSKAWNSTWSDRK